MLITQNSNSDLCLKGKPDSVLNRGKLCCFRPSTTLGVSLEREREKKKKKRSGRRPRNTSENGVLVAAFITNWVRKALIMKRILREAAIIMSARIHYSCRLHASLHVLFFVVLADPSFFYISAFISFSFFSSSFVRRAVVRVRSLSCSHLKHCSGKTDLIEGTKRKHEASCRHFGPTQLLNLYLYVIIYIYVAVFSKYYHSHLKTE